MEVHLHPHLTRMWAPVGQQPEIPAPGRNQKKIVYGGVNYRTGKITYTLADSKCGTQFILFLMTLLAGYTGKRLLVVCDNGRFHTTQAAKVFLQLHRDKMRILWLPPYCPSLNLIERLWGHVKRTFLANVLYQSLDDLLKALKKGLSHLNQKRDRVAFLYTNQQHWSQNQPSSLRRAA
jgi:putative transposase